MAPTRARIRSMHSSACQLESTYSQTGSRGLPWNRPGSRAGSDAARPRRNEIDSSEMFSCVQRAAAAALEEKSEIGISLDHDEIVVAGQAEVAALAGERHAAVGLGAVAHEIAEAPDLLGAARLDVGEDGLEGRQVSVHV